MAAVLRRTKIVATIGPSSSSEARIRALAEAGMNAARLNLSHGTHEDHAASAALVRRVQAELDRPLALIADLQGPKVRIGDLASPRSLVEGEEVVVVGEQTALNGELPIMPALAGSLLEPGNDVLINDGLVRLAVEEVVDGRARCRVVVGGEVGPHKGVNLPGVRIPIPSMTEKDTADLEFALRLGVDYVALSFVRSADDVRELQPRSASTARQPA
jgi:pyruvate kinase